MGFDLAQQRTRLHHLWHNCWLLQRQSWLINDYHCTRDRSVTFKLTVLLLLEKFPSLKSYQQAEKTYKHIIRRLLIHNCEERACARFMSKQSLRLALLKLMAQKDEVILINCPVKCSKCTMTLNISLTFTVVGCEMYYSHCVMFFNKGAHDSCVYTINTWAFLLLW